MEGSIRPRRIQPLLVSSFSSDSGATNTTFVSRGAEDTQVPDLALHGAEPRALVVNRVVRRAA